MNHVRHYIFIVLLMLFTCKSFAFADDGFIRGYATAVLEREFNLINVPITVTDGVIVLDPEDIQAADPGRVLTILLNIKGVRRVKIQGLQMQTSGEAYAAPARHQGKDLFAPLIADPRWPHFSIAYQYYTHGGDLKNAGAVSFGETLPFYNGNAPRGGRWQAGIQAAVFALFDLDAPSWDLLNEDYIVALPVSYRRDSFSGMFRVYHRSSHVGDELLLRSRKDRVDFSYEALDLKLSYDLGEWFRIYGGGEYAFSRTPKDLKPWATQYGFEFGCPLTYLNGSIRPVAGIDFRNREENDWRSEISLNLGVNIENSKIMDHRVQLMLGYYNGNSPDGQFSKVLIEYLSLGAHFYF